MGNTPCYYTLRSCGLHHGHHINSRHYTALIFNENTVLKIDDEQAHDRTEDWKSYAGSTVYLAFYSKGNFNWLNDNIVDAYISLLVKSAAGRNLRVNALNCFFNEKVTQIVAQKSKRKSFV